MPNALHSFIPAVVLAVLFLACILFARAKAVYSHPARKMTVVVKWGREKYFINLPAPTTKLAELRRSLAEFTQLPEHSFKLIHAGAAMKDDTAPISTYGIREGSVIAIIGDPKPPLSQPNNNDAPHQYHSNTTSQHKTEASTIHQIQTELDKVRTTLWPSVDTLLSHISPPSHQEKPTTHALDQEHKRLSELLLQSLLRLDAITTDGEWEEARRERKGAVKEVQGLLDRLDEGWGRRM